MSKLIRIILICQSLLMSACYSFVGSSLSPEVKSIYITPFNNKSSLYNPNLAQTFTLDLIDKFDQRTNLNISNNREGDIEIKGDITNYFVTPVNIGVGSNGNETANQNKLTIEVIVQYINNVEPEKNWTTKFSDSEPFESNQTLDSVEDGLIEIINERLINQIFNKIVTDW